MLFYKVKMTDLESKKEDIEKPKKEKLEIAAGAFVMRRMNRTIGLYSKGYLSKTLLDSSFEDYFNILEDKRASPEVMNLVRNMYSTLKNIELDKEIDLDYLIEECF